MKALEKVSGLISVFVFLLSAAVWGQFPGGDDAANIVIIGGKVWTGAPDLGQEELTGVAIKDGRIRSVGSDATVMTFYSPVTTKLLDVKGRRVIPGITDSHTHLISGGFQLQRLNLRDAKNKEDFLKRIAGAVKGKSKADWVLGGRWSVESWPNPETPRASWLDPITGDVPVFLTRMDGHSALANSEAMRVGGVSKDTEDPVGGEIVRDPKTGEPTGILRESAMELVTRVIPEPKQTERFAALARAMNHANSLGITAVHDMSDKFDLVAFRDAVINNTLTLRITCYLMTDAWNENLGRVARHEYGLTGDMARLVGLKGFMDGSLGSRTAYMFEPFSDSTPDTPHSRGQLTAFALDDYLFQQSVIDADRAGLQVAVHAIGDKANHLLLDAYEEASRQNGTIDRYHRVEHAQILKPEDIPRFADLRVVASMQPYHKADDGRYAEKALGKERLKGAYAYRQLLDSGAMVIFGSDWPVVTMNPFKGIDAAVNARTLDGKVWLPSHSLTVDEALRAYTVMPAKAIHRDQELGTIEAGKWADLVVLEDDVLTMPKEKIGDARVSYTIVNGKIVYQRDKK